MGFTTTIGIRRGDGAAGWPQYLRGSALHEAVQAGPGGSTFVSPATLPASTATAPLQTAPLQTAPLHTAPANNSAAR